VQTTAYGSARYLAVDREISRLFHKAWMVAVMLCVGFGGWATSFSISGAVIAPGTFAVGSKHKVVQHLDGGVIASIHVKDGDLVQEGQLLLTLDSQESKGDIAGLDSEIAARSEQVALIEGELKNLLKLQAKQLVAYNRVAALQREAASLSGDIARLASQKSRIQARLARVGPAC